MLSFNYYKMPPPIAEPLLYISLCLVMCCDSSQLLPSTIPADHGTPPRLPDAPSLVVQGLMGHGLTLKTASGHVLNPDSDVSYNLNSLGLLRAQEIAVAMHPLRPDQTCQIRPVPPHIIVECTSTIHAPCSELFEEGSLPFASRPVLNLQEVLSSNGELIYFTSFSPINDHEMFVSSAGGQVWFVELSSGRSHLALDLSGRLAPTEAGLVSFRIPNDFDDNMYAYAMYDAALPRSPTTTLSRFTYSRDTGTFGSEQIILSVDDRPADAYQHSGGDIAFYGKDHLFAAFGDGAFLPDPSPAFDLIQSLETLHGKIIRLDISGDTVRVPEDNPFYHHDNPSVRREIFASGFRNPFRISVDPDTGILWAADVGHERWEEVNRVKAGGNYGWPAMEGPECFSDHADCDEHRYLLPFYAYPRHIGKSITGGLVLRSSNLPSLEGFYIFADYMNGSIRSIDTVSATTFESELIARTSAPVDIRQMPNGRVLVLGLLGSLDELVGLPPKEQISSIAESGCLDASRELLPGFSHYEVGASFWSDGADKRRFVYVPDGRSAGIGTNGALEFPIGSIFVKEFSREGRRLETRFMWQPTAGDWRAATFVWDAAGRVATRVSEGTTLDLGAGETWEVPAETGCFQCHTEASGVVLGAEVNQLARAIDWRGRPDLNQLDLWTDLGYLPEGSGSLDHGQPLSLVSGTLEQQARSYLHANCASCHRPGSGGRSRMDLRSVTPLSSTAMCDVVPLVDDLGLANARLVAPGAPERSVLLSRLSSTGVHQMPPVGIVQPDPQGIDILTRWIEALTGCE